MSLLSQTTLFHEHNARKRRENDQETNGILVFKNEIWYLTDKSYNRPSIRDALLWLIRYVYIFAISTYLVTFNQCLKYFSEKLHVG